MLSRAGIATKLVTALKGNPVSSSLFKPFDLEYLETSLLAKLLAMGRP